MREFMDEDDDQQTSADTSADLPEVCRCLRTKTAFGTSIGYRPWQRGESSTAVYWCLNTMGSAGPDDGFVHPHRCRLGRMCYRSSDELD
jgi:hypothetical protein